MMVHQNYTYIFKSTGLKLWFIWLHYTKKELWFALKLTRELNITSLACGYRAKRLNLGQTWLIGLFH